MTTYLRLSSKYYVERYLKVGWSLPETDFVWNNGNAAKIVVPVGDQLGDWSLRLVVNPFLYEGCLYQGFQMQVNDAVIGQCVVHRQLQTIELLVPASLVVGKSEVEITFAFMHAQRPCDVVVGATDDRLLAIALFELELKPLGAPFGSLSDVESIQFAGEDVGRYLRAEREQDAARVDESLRTDGIAARSLTMMIESFIRGVGANIHVRRRMEDEICKIAARDAPTDRREIFAIGHQLRREAVQYYTPELSPLLLIEGDFQDVQRDELIPAKPNELYDANVRLAYFGHMQRKERPALELISSRGLSVHAHPYHCVVYKPFEATLISFLNPQQLDVSILNDRWVQADRDLVIVQDLFDCGNLAHFLFDVITRVFYFCEARPELSRNAIFVFGGWPSEFHQLVLEATASLLNLSREQFLFPRSGSNISTTKSVFWFSDQLDFNHPAQRMQQRSVGFLKRLGGVLKARSERTGNIYISRSDASTRRLSNEGEVLRRLKAFNFRVLELSALTAQEQIDTVANASFVLGPHGMGFTHLAFSDHKPIVVELFNPEVGSESYALLAKAYGFTYEAIVGVETDPGSRDFSVDPDEVVSVVAKLLMLRSQQEPA